MHFPWDTMGRYLEGVHTKSIARREIAVQWGLASSVMQRNRAYREVDELRVAVCDGAVARLESGCFFPDEDRVGIKGLDHLWYPIEFRLDVDITDYHGVLCDTHDARTGACDVCWETRLEPGMRVLLYLLEEVMGIHHVIRVWSGNKGYHLLCMDRACLEWDDATRAALLEQLQQPRDASVLDHVYDEILWPLFMEQYGGEFPQHRLRPEWLAHGTDFDLSGKSQQEALQFIQECLWGELWTVYKRGLLRLLYWPRVDAAPLQSGHLLKVPFCIHEKSRKVSLPLCDPSTFRPSTAPTALDILEGRYDMSPSIRYTELILDRAEEAAAEEIPLPPMRFPDTFPYLMGVNWTGRSPEEYAAGVAGVAQALGPQCIVMAPDHEWRIRFVAAGCPKVLLECMGKEACAGGGGFKSIVVSHWDAHTPSILARLTERFQVVLGFVADTDDPSDSGRRVVARSQGHLIQTAKRLRQFQLSYPSTIRL